MIKLLLIVLGLVVVVSLAGYFYGTLNREEAPALKLKEQVSSPSGQERPSQVDTYQTCTNTSKKFSIKYPSDWFTNKSGDLCHYFGVDSSVDEKNSLLTLNSSYTQKEFNDLKATLTRSDEERIVLNTSNLEVDSFNTQRVETEATGVGVSAKGSKSVFYLIENTKLPVVFSYVETAALPNREEVLELMEVMVGSLVFN